MNSKAVFDIYKASAGSGKTYTLVREYLFLLFKSVVVSDLHRKILAVTFTNKATGEMKRRIVESLFEICSGKSSFIDDILAKYDDQYETREDVEKKAHDILRNILDNYSGFNVKTIDSFFQQVLRGFAQEISFHNNFTVQIDKNEIIESAVDDIIFNLSKESGVYDYVEKYALMQVTAGKGLNIKASLLQMVLNLYNDEFQTLPKESFELRMFDSVIDKIDNSEGALKLRIKNVMGDILAAFERNGLELGDVKGGLGRSFAKYYDYETLRKADFKPTDTFYASLMVDDIDKWAKKADQDRFIVLLGDTRDSRKMLNELLVAFRTVVLIKKNLYIIAILKSVRERMEESARESKMMTISSTGEFINKIIENTETPFIYEKIGVFVENYMIDEFQDTSVLQWENFKPLLKESVSQMNWNMVVGDVKQSIYRWREGDWDILNNRVQIEMTNADTKVNTLGRNYRSCRNVVCANNFLLEGVVENCKDYLYEDAYVGLGAEMAEDRWKMFKGLYEDVKQEPVKKEEGSYNVCFVRDEDKDVDWEEVAMGRMLKDIEMLKENGYLYSDITVLVRRNKEATMVANYLLENGISVMSSEALMIKNSQMVQFVVIFMRYLANVRDVLSRFNLTITYAMLFGEEERILGDLDRYVCGVFEGEYEWETMVFGETIANELRGVKMFSNYELALSLVTIFDIVDRDVDYVQAFLDVVYEFEIGGDGEVGMFMEYWDKKCDSLKLSTANEGDSVNIYTIHKAKGMEYEVVLIPFCDWGLKPNTSMSNYVWVDAKDYDEKITGGLPLVPVDLGKGYSAALRTLFADKAREEYEKCCIDELNVSYVALTRAVKHLYLYARLNEKKGGFTLQNLMYGALTEGGEREGFVKTDEEDVVRYSLGSVEANEREEEKEKKVCVLDIKKSSYASVDGYLRLKGDDKTSIVIERSTHYGRQMHSLLENVVMKDDVARVLETIVLENEREAIRALMGRFMDYSDEVRSWFDGSYDVLNEREILTPEGRIYRPDRVMVDRAVNKVIVVDYKFGAKREKYVKQVRTYMELLKGMGYGEVEGRICYIDGERCEAANFCTIINV